MFRFRAQRSPETMEQLIGKLTAIADQKADKFRQTHGGRTYGNKFHKLAILLSKAQSFARTEGI